MKIHVAALVEAACVSALAGAATVAAAFAAWLVAGGLADGLPGDLLRDLPYAFIFVIFAGVVALAPYIAGTLVIGIPTFLILNQAGWTTPIHAVLIGSALSGLAGLLLTGGETSALPLVGMAAVGGAVAGLAFRKVAYTPD